MNAPFAGLALPFALRIPSNHLLKLMLFLPCCFGGSLEANAAGGEGIATNLKNITENEAQIHDLYLTVMTNKKGRLRNRIG